MSVNTKIHGLWGEVSREMTRLDNPAPRAKRAFDSVLAKGFKITQAAVHVKTGSLKTSGKKNSIWWEDSWHGEISYGGVSRGPENPVTYAIYEKARDGDHDFIDPLKALHPLYIEAMLKVL